MPKPTHKPTHETRTQVVAMCAVGVNHDIVAKYIGITKPTLVKHYPKEIKHAKAMQLCEVGNQLHQAAMMALRDPKYLSALFFLAKTQHGFRETQHIEVSNTDYLVGSDAKPDDMSAEDWLAQHQPQYSEPKAANGNGKAH